jgi:dolichol-phosphate mannosyltransferase
MNRELTGSPVRDWAVVSPLSNEEETVVELSEALSHTMNLLQGGVVYYVIDLSSTDSTLDIATAISKKDPRFQILWRPEVRNVVQAYLEGFRQAYNNQHEIIIEMDGGLAHDPRSIPLFLDSLTGGVECVFGSRFCQGGGIAGANFLRMLLSKGGTMASNLMLGTSYSDATSGFQAFSRKAVSTILDCPIKSTGHFYQTEVRYLLRNFRHKEVPIFYRGDGRNVGWKSFSNAIESLSYYTVRRSLAGLRESS